MRHAFPIADKLGNDFVIFFGNIYEFVTRLVPAQTMILLAPLALGLNVQIPMPADHSGHDEFALDGSWNGDRRLADHPGAVDCQVDNPADQVIGFLVVNKKIVAGSATFLASPVAHESVSTLIGSLFGYLLYRPKFRPALAFQIEQ
jgi:hypothetical protein